MMVTFLSEPDLALDSTIRGLLALKHVATKLPISSGLLQHRDISYSAIVLDSRVLRLKSVL